MTQDIDEAEAVVAVCDLLMGRIEELQLLWGRSSSDVCELLDAVYYTLNDALWKAKQEIAADDLWSTEVKANWSLDLSPPRGGGMQDGE